MIECNWIGRVADPDRNIGVHRQPNALWIDIDPDDCRSLWNIFGPDLKRTSVLDPDLEQVNRLLACSKSRKCGFVNRKIMFHFVGDITFMFHKHPTESTGGSRVSGVRKFGDRGPGHGGLALAHKLASWMSKPYGASQAIIGEESFSVGARQEFGKDNLAYSTPLSQSPKPISGHCHGNRIGSPAAYRIGCRHGPLCYRRHRFPPEIIQHAIWLYLRFALSYRDIEER